MSLIVYVALIAAAVLAVRRGPGRALVAVYLPVLLLIPDAFRAVTPGLPDPNFNQAAILPIVAVAFVRYAPRWRPTLSDVLVLAYAATIGTSDFHARGYDAAQNLMFAMITSVVGPYFAARWAVAAERLDIAVARRIVMLVFVVALVSFYEFRFGYNPFFAYIGMLFPGQGGGWVTTFRHGVARVAGPYSHAILAGLMMVMAFRLQRWLQWGGHWEPRFRHLRLPWAKASVISLVLVLGSAMTVARGPWLGAFFAAVMVAAGRARDRTRALRLALAAAAVSALVGAVLLQSYLDVRPGEVMTMSQESAIARKVIFETYVEVALDHAWLGWGLTSWPRLNGMDSIDNYYLLLVLMHGVPAAAMFATLLMLSSVRLVRRGLRDPAGTLSPGFTFAGILVATSVALGTVYLGEQVLPMLFLVLGWSEGWRVSAPSAIAGPARAAATRPPFRAVIA